MSHSLLVEQVAVTISQLLNEKGMHVNVDSVSKAAILHDIGKESAKSLGKDHAAVGAQICEKEGIDERICNIMKNHAVEAILDDKLNSIEDKILFYADKICKMEIIGIDKRFEPWEKKHPSKDLPIAKERTIALEKEILDKLNLTQEELLIKLRGTAKIQR